jgi:hypothetical protein
MILRQPKIHVGIRIVAAGCIVLWLQATSHCAIERLFGDDHHHAEAGASETLAQHDSGHSQEAKAAEHANGEASHPQNSEQPSHDSHRHNDGDNCCCSTVMATAQIATPFVIIKPVLEPLDFLFTVLQARDPVLAAPGDKVERQAKDRDGVFKPEVCLDPAHRSLAPPSLA